MRITIINHDILSQHMTNTWCWWWEMRAFTAVVNNAMQGVHACSGRADRVSASYNLEISYCSCQLCLYPPSADIKAAAKLVAEDANFTLAKYCRVFRCLCWGIITVANWTMFCHRFNNMCAFPSEGRTSWICAAVT